MMRNIVLLMFIALPFLGFCQKITWYNIEQAGTLNRQMPRKIIIDVYTDWCSWCKVMDSNTFSHPYISGYLQQHFYPVKLNAETHDTIRFFGTYLINLNIGRRSTHQLAQMLLSGQMSYPSMVIMNENFQVMTVVPGYLPPEKMEPILVYFAEEKYRQYKTYDDFLKDFKTGIK